MLLEIIKRDSLQLCPYLTEDVLSTKHFLKMRTSLAKRLFSTDVSSAIRTLVSYGQMPKECLTTAFFIDHIRKWGEIMMAKTSQAGLLLDHDKKCDNQTFLRESIKFVQELKIGASGIFLPSQRGHQIATSSVLGIQGQLFSLGYKYVLPGNLLGDAVENVFSTMRHKNPIPSSQEFTDNLRAVTLSQFLSVKTTSNYEAEKVDYYLVDYFSLSKNSLKCQERTACHQETSQGSRNSICCNEDFIDDLNDTEDEEEQECSVSDEDEEEENESNESVKEKAEISDREKQSLYSLGGRILSSIKKRNTWCNECFQECGTVNPLSEIISESLPALFVLQKDFSGGAMNYISRKVFQMLLSAEKEIREMERKGNIPEVAVKSSLQRHLQRSLKDYHFRMCHNIKEKILYHFLSFRINIIACKQRKNVKDKTQRSQSNRDSRSMFMRAMLEE